MLEEDERTITERDKLDYLLDSIQNMALAAAVSTISMSQTLCTSFKEAAGILLCEVQHIPPSQPTAGKELSHKWMPTTMDQAKAVELTKEEEEVDHKVVEAKEKEAEEVAKEAVEVRAAEEAMSCSMELTYQIPTAHSPEKKGINSKDNTSLSGTRGTKRAISQQQARDEGKAKKPQICRQG